MPELKTRILLASLLLKAIYSFGQQAISLKAYQNTDIFQVQCIRLDPMEETKEVKTNFSRISFALLLQSKKKYFHEVEFQIPEFSKPLEKLDFPLKYTVIKEARYDATASSFSFRYELGKVLGDKTKPVHFLLSAGINPYYLQLEYIPAASNLYYSSYTYYGFVMNAIPRLYLKVSPHITIDLNMPFRIYDFQVEKFRVDNPILPEHQQRFTETHHLFFEPVYTIRLGLMYTLSKING